MSLTNFELSITVTLGYESEPTVAVHQHHQDPHAPDDQGCLIATAAGLQRQDTQDNKALEKS
ncbi:hypothetical protein TSAR_002144 [Trichomalopsis sarcophagae]|uniref:Uncharacterized protein n=1 Tax=Trichomalopsis sarcophagae TaxID=543379 RepID=A0A232EJR9_9HYME|nr:hypothetical protein TSAR_002144 [Trichomalopsis sarcophagae]